MEALRLKIASMILFWFGVIAELIVIVIALGQFYYDGYSRFLTPFKSSDVLLNTANFVYTTFGHFVHMVSAYWLAKGTRKGIILALSLSIYEIVSFLVPRLDPDVYTISGFGIRVIFAIIIALLVLGRKDLPILKSANWRPWMFSKIADKSKNSNQ